MGGGPSKDDEHGRRRALVGLENTSNVCFSNCVLQVLYHCVDLRVRLLDYAATRLPYVGAHGTLLHRVCELFVEMAEIEKRNGEGGGGKCSPNAFIACLRKNDLFSAPTQHDAHELLIYVLNELSDEIAKYEPKPSGVDGDGKPLPRAPTFVQELFEGQLVNETECLHCSTITRRSESFFDLSVQLRPTSSISACLAHFSDRERMQGNDKFRCDKCNELRDADRWMSVTRPPRHLFVHLKRFHYDDKLHDFRKLSSFIAFGAQQRLGNLHETAECDPLYELVAFVVHVGSGVSMGHYVSVVRNKGTWMLLDDDHSEPVTETYVQRCFGSYDGSYHAECAYILVYRARDDSIVRSTSAAALAEHVTDEADEDVNVGALADGMADAIAPPDAIDAVS